MTVLRRRLAWIAATVLLAWGQCAGAHPVHFSFAEAEWNADAQCLEVAMRMDPEALQRAVRRRAETAEGRQASLESPAADALIRQYLLEQFVVEPTVGKQAEIRWVGRETTLTSAWVYFEVALPDGPDGIRISNRLFFEQSPEQVNVVDVRDGNRRGTVQLTVTAPTRTLKLTADALP